MCYVYVSYYNLYIERRKICKLLLRKILWYSVVFVSSRVFDVSFDLRSMLHLNYNIQGLILRNPGASTRIGAASALG
jgi:hypothetical protein